MPSWRKAACSPAQPTLEEQMAIAIVGLGVLANDDRVNPRTRADALRCKRNLERLISGPSSHSKVQADSRVEGRRPAKEG
jgi:hypothetical protein